MDQPTTEDPGAPYAEVDQPASVLAPGLGWGRARPGDGRSSGTDPPQQGRRTLASFTARTSGPAEVVAEPLRIDVPGSRPGRRPGAGRARKHGDGAGTAAGGRGPGAGRRGRRAPAHQRRDDGVRL